MQWYGFMKIPHLLKSTVQLYQPNVGSKVRVCERIRRTTAVINYFFKPFKIGVYIRFCGALDLSKYNNCHLAACQIFNVQQT